MPNAPPDVVNAPKTVRLALPDSPIPGAGGSILVPLTITPQTTVWQIAPLPAWVWVSMAAGTPTPTYRGGYNGLSGYGNATLCFVVSPNPGTTDREAIVSINDVPFTIRQKWSTAAELTRRAAFIAKVPFVKTQPDVVASFDQDQKPCPVPGVPTSALAAATSSEAWIKAAPAASPAAGSATPTLMVSTALNPEGFSRAGTIGVGGKTLTVFQRASIRYPWNHSGSVFGGDGHYEELCVRDTGFRVRMVLHDAWTTPILAKRGNAPWPRPRAAVADVGGGGVILLTVDPPTASWTATSEVPWLSVTPSSGTGSATLEYSAASNVGGLVRAGSLQVAGRGVDVVQDGVAPTFTFLGLPLAAPVLASGGTGYLGVNVEPDGAPWEATTSQPSWLSVTPSNASGDSLLTWRCTPNPGFASRSGTLTFGEQTLAISQEGTDVPVRGGTSSMALTASGPWTASSSDPWLTVSPTTGTGNATLTLTVTANPDAYGRAATITAAGQSFLVRQNGDVTMPGTTSGVAAAVRFGEVRTDGPLIAVPAAGLGSDFQITVRNDAAWTVTSAAPWFTTSLAKGVGSVRTTYVAAPNTGTMNRMTTVTIAGTTWRFLQAGQTVTFIAPPGEDAMPTTRIASLGGTGQVPMTISPANAGWTATSNAPWLTLPQPRGTGSAMLAFTAAPNPGPARTGSIKVGDQWLRVTQAATAVIFDPPLLAMSAKGGQATVTMMVDQPGAPWTASASAPWLKPSPATGVGNNALAVTVAANTGAAARSGTIRVGQQQLTVTQGGLACTFASPGASIPAAGGSGSVAITTDPPDGIWTAFSSVGWLTVTPTGGTGAATLAYSCYPNNFITPRFATIMVAGQAFRVTQAGR